MLKYFVLGSTILSTAACATPYTPIPFDSDITPVETIQIVDDSFSDEPTSQNLASNGHIMSSAMAASAGLAGALVGAVAAGVEANIEAGQRRRIQDALDTVGFDGETVFDEALAKALTERDYELDALSIDRKSYRQLIDLEPDETAAVDMATLDIAGAGYGYQLIGGSTQWRPFVSAEVRLTSTNDPENILMLNRVVYNPVATPDVIVNLSPEPKYGFVSVDDIEADPQLAAEGLTVALVSTAEAIAQLLNRTTITGIAAEVADAASEDEVVATVAGTDAIKEPNSEVNSEMSEPINAVAEAEPQAQAEASEETEATTDSAPGIEADDAKTSDAPEADPEVENDNNDV